MRNGNYLFQKTYESIPKALRPISIAGVCSALFAVGYGITKAVITIVKSESDYQDIINSTLKSEGIR